MLPATVSGHTRHVPSVWIPAFAGMTVEGYWPLPWGQRGQSPFALWRGAGHEADGRNPYCLPPQRRKHLTELGILQCLLRSLRFGEAFLLEARNIAFTFSAPSLQRSSESNWI